MKQLLTLLFLFVTVFAYGQKKLTPQEQAIQDSIAVAQEMIRVMEEMDKLNQQESQHPKSKEEEMQDSLAAAEEAAKMEAEIKKMMDELAKVDEEKNKIFKDTAYVDSLKKANKDFSFVGTWRGKIDKEEITFIFFKDSTWRAHSSKKQDSDIAGTWYTTSDSLFLEGTETKKNYDGQSKKKVEKIYVAYLPYKKKEVWLYIPFLKEKTVLKKQQ